ncbi:nucleoside triphosphate pyrophosphohydrolase [Acinetobacter qingfengensis]|uniref:Nucleoside triphosphate pyrophosphohydrolase n=1 Tax=Acinetobacter qingfengensis TaxID=1262585 RepID=A0A1E7QXF2_9GAMM|nr:nucleoside triphosphate pyrophosphohydrolase [Acinetobacter qingfengensis]KAA8731626.1 nucleoside triphosphate pyrophosphohydrolase [Acinetobacter qingfengensis]OEY91729.1 nucleoside triphosphate pyrophosphohydrolase [Acinetobacter qingfengensis]
MQDLLELMQTLREKCPWDREQTPASLTPYAIEEAYEVEDAVRSGEIAHIQEELGDLLLQVIFQAQMYSEQGAFDFYDVVEGLKQKLIRRHPHVFDENYVNLSTDQVNALWTQIKQQEKQQRGQTHVSALDQVKLGASIHQAQQIQQYAAKLNFDWENVEGAWLKFDEEIQELKQAIQQHDPVHIEEELGDSLFALINVGRKLQQNCDQALLATISKFRSRFAYIEQQLAQQGLRPEQCNLSQLDDLWNQAKDAEKV